HLAVHSAKDMPAEMPAGLVIAAVPPRADPRDALVSRDGLEPADLPRGARVGTGSERRRAQLLALRADLEIVSLRGNVETRLAAALDGELDAVVLAMAGLERVGLAREHAARIHPLDAAAFLPAAGQGALAVQAQAGSPAAALAEAIDHRPSHDALQAERAVLTGLGADCHSCVAVHVARDGDVWRARGLSDAAGSRIVRAEASGESAGAAGRNLLDALMALGAARKSR
ncbi:MAG TPA: hydroxymethylbilane synthase, partial [Phycisphaerae bacterium]|nr:hydroxymethylbilane synthase [Phycisphaerae bacterium]